MTQYFFITELRGEIVRQVKTAYFRLLQAERGVEVYAAAEGLVRENLRVSQRLLAADRITEDAVLRARAEVLEVEQERDEAIRERDLARAFLNFLLNRPLEGKVETTPAPADTTAFGRSAGVDAADPGGGAGALRGADAGEGRGGGAGGVRRRWDSIPAWRLFWPVVRGHELIDRGMEHKVKS